MQPHGYELTTHTKYSVWRNQLIISELWDEDRFESHLRSNYGFGINDYLDKKANRFCVLISTNIVKRSHSDGDI